MKDVKTIKTDIDIERIYTELETFVLNEDNFQDQINDSHLSVQICLQGIDAEMDPYFGSRTLKHITDDGLDELNHEMKKCRILGLGIELRFTNRNNNPFKVIVCPDVLTNDDNMRRVLYEKGKSVEKNFPHIAGNEVSRHKGV